MENEKQIAVDSVISFTTIPRHITTDFIEKKLQRNEWILLVWLRSLGDTYGFVNGNTTALRDDMFPSVKVNTVEKLLSSLRSKGYIRYENHQGQRGSFRIELDEWMMKKAGFRSFLSNKTIEQGDARKLNTDHKEEVPPKPTHNLYAQAQNM